MNLHDPQLERLARSDPKQIIESFFFIVNKSGFKVPFILNEPQKLYYNERSSRDDILKARKEGFSSLILACFTAKFLFVPNSVSMCVSHRDEDTKKLLRKVYYYIDNLPFKVTLEKASSNLLRIKEMNTEFAIATAGSKTAGRGDTVHNLHLSEYAFYPSYEMVTGMTNAVPDDPLNTWVVKETTANGYGNAHHQAWMDEIRGDSTFKPHFFGWHKTPEYTMTLIDGVKFDDKERQLQESYNLTDEQLYWRQWKLKSMQPTQDYTREDLFRQEFPISDTEAFLSTGRPVFNPDTLDWYDSAMCMEPIKRGELVGWSPPFFEDNPLGALRIYKTPVPGKKYVIGGDTAEEGDYSALVVLERETMETVAVWWGHVDEFELARIAYRMGIYYNTALVGIERNNMGVAVVMKLDELAYPNLYRMEILDEFGMSAPTDKLGWETNSRTRPIMLGDLIQIINERTLILRSKETLSELRSLIRGRANRPEAQVGTHDDLVMALAVAYQMFKTLSAPTDNDEVFVRNYRPNSTLNNFLPKK